jgi:hypothetical protein
VIAHRAAPARATRCTTRAIPRRVALAKPRVAHAQSAASGLAALLRFGGEALADRGGIAPVRKLHASPRELPEQGEQTIEERACRSGIDDVAPRISDLRAR